MKKKIILGIIIGAILITALFIILKKDKLVFLSYEDTIYDNSYMEKIYTDIETLEEANVDFMDQYMLTFNERLNYSIEKKYANILLIGETTAKKEVEMLAKHYEDKIFINLDTSFDTNLDNLVGITFDTYNTSYIAGYIAGKTTQTNKVAFLGENTELSEEMIKGFSDGALSSNPNVIIAVELLETTANISKTDYTQEDTETKEKVKNISDNIYKMGNDIIYHNVGSHSKSIIESAEANNKYIIASGYDETALSDSIIAATTKNPTEALKIVLKDYKEKKLKNNYNFSFDDKAIDIITTPITKELDKEINMLKKELTK